LRRVLESHGDVEPIEDRWLGDAGIGRDRPQAGTTVGECGHLGVVGSAHGFKVSADQRFDVGARPYDRSEHLPASGSGLDVADPNLQVPFAVFTAADEGRIQGDRDRRRRGWRLDRGGIAALLADFQRMMPQCLGVPPGVDRQQVSQYASGDSITHQGGKVSLQLVQLRCRPTMRWPTDASLATATARAKKSWKPHPHPAEQRRDLMKPPVLHMAPPAAGPAIRP